MEKSKEQPVNSASGTTTRSKLRYPLRSAVKSKEGKPPVPDLSGSSGYKRGRVGSTVSQSTTALDLSSKGEESGKPTRRFSIPTKSASNSASKSVSSLTPISESRAKQSRNVRGLTEKPVSSVPRSTNRRKVEDLSSATYWLTQIKLSESVGKHPISLGFFKLAQQAGCEPFQKMREELKLYGSRNNMDELADAMMELCQLYNVSEDPKQSQTSETCSVAPEAITVSFNSDAQSVSSTPENLNTKPDIPNNDTTSQSSTATQTAKEKSVKNMPQGRTRRSLNAIKVNPGDGPKVQESEEGTWSSDDGVLNGDAKSANVKRTNRKEVVSKNTPSVRTRKVATSSATPRTLRETLGDRSQKKAERITNPRGKKNQEEKIKKATKKPVSKQEQVISPEETKVLEENKENSVDCTTQEMQVE